MSQAQAPLLLLRDFGVGFGQRTILKQLNLDIATHGVTQLLGPCGAGKSTLLRSLAGFNDQSALFKTRGEAFYRGEPLGQNGRPLMLEQKPAEMLYDIKNSILSGLNERSVLNSDQQRDLIERLLERFKLTHLRTKMSQALTSISLLERRMVQILGLIAQSPDMIMLDEPTANLEQDEAQQIMDMIIEMAQQHSVIVVQHNQLYAKYLGGKAILLAGGTIQEIAPARQLLENPVSAAGQEFKGSGTCAAPSPDTDPALLDEAFVARYQPVVPRSQKAPEIIPFGPSGFRWIKRDYLAATPRPGIHEDLLHDLKALAKVKIDQLISLEEQVFFDASQLPELGIKLYHLPIRDMGVPQPEQAFELVQYIHKCLMDDQRVAVHCKAGLGRTGTILAAYYVFLEIPVSDAIQKIRCVDPRMIQSRTQEEFLQTFAQYLSSNSDTSV